MKENIVKEKSYVFAIKIVNLYKYLSVEKNEFVLSKQLLRSGTAIGALVREAEQAESRADFIHKLSIALKEANETAYWLCLLKDTNHLTVKQHEETEAGINELLRLLTSIIKSAKKMEKE